MFLTVLSKHPARANNRADRSNSTFLNAGEMVWNQINSKNSEKQ